MFRYPGDVLLNLWLTRLSPDLWSEELSLAPSNERRGASRSAQIRSSTRFYVLWGARVRQDDHI